MDSMNLIRSWTNPPKTQPPLRRILSRPRVLEPISFPTTSRDSLRSQDWRQQDMQPNKYSITVDLLSRFSHPSKKETTLLTEWSSANSQRIRTMPQALKASLPNRRLSTSTQTLIESWGRTTTAFSEATAYHSWTTTSNCTKTSKISCSQVTPWRSRRTIRSTTSWPCQLTSIIITPTRVRASRPAPASLRNLVSMTKVYKIMELLSCTRTALTPTSKRQARGIPKPLSSLSK